MAQPEKETSFDKASLHNWRFSETNGFVVKDYTGLEKGQEPVIMVLKCDDIFEYIAEAAREQRKITVFAIGPCVMDMS